jgi:uncharacterized protein (DUF2252 family)
MRADPFQFFRGGAAIMAADLASRPVTGMRVQLCGDAHLQNFAGYLTPERNFIFDVDDFDETLPGPWEWDVARLCASVALLAHVRSFGKRCGSAAAYCAAQAYRRHMRGLAIRSPLEIWYSHVDVRGMLKRELLAPRSADYVKPTPEHEHSARGVLERYRESLEPHVSLLLEKYHPVELFEYPMGVGSVGLLVMIAHYESREGAPLYLQIKQAQASALEPYLGRSVYRNHGERAIVGQHLMQAATDLFVGWSSDGERDFYVRQFRDGKASLDIDGINAAQLIDFSSWCGRVLGRAHARTGDAQMIARYLGASDVFERGMLRFARVYAAQVVRDYEEFCRE